MNRTRVYTSRSRVEHFQDCARYGYIGYLWDGRGIVKKGASVYLSTGQYTHLGLEIIFTWCKPNNNFPPETIIDSACQKATKAYRDEISKRGFDLEEGEDYNNERYVVEEQCALVEGFIRAFCVVILPDLLERYTIVDVEREEILELEDGELVVQGRIDVVLMENDSSDLYIISFKTAANWDRRQEKANEHDNQGLSETLLLESRLHEENSNIARYFDTSGDHLLGSKALKATVKYREYMQQFLKNEKVMGVIMIYFLKGKRTETSKGSKKWEQNSPLVKGYRKLIGVDYEYAPSLYYEKPENKSGWGRLGKGWEDFNVWDCEEVGGVKGWIQKLANNEISNGLQTLKDQFKQPTAYFRKQEHLDSWLRQTIAIEQDIKGKVVFVNNAVKSGTDIDIDSKHSLKIALDYYFDQRRKMCHYPNDCPYLKICYNDEIFNDPIGSGLFMYREPHHEAEAKEHERLYQITNKQVKEAKKDINIYNDDEEVIEG